MNWISLGLLPLCLLIFFALAWIRDQDGPWWPGQKPASAEGNKWKEGGLIVMGFLMGGAVAYNLRPFGVEVFAVGGGVGAALAALAWSLGHDILDRFVSKANRRGNAIGLWWHPGRNGKLDGNEAALNLALGGGLMILPLAVAHAVAASISMALVAVAIAALGKLGSYIIGWLIDRNGHPTFIGHLGHGLTLGLAYWMLLP